MSGAGFDISNLLSPGGVTVFVLLFCTHFLVLEAIFLSFARRSASRSQLKRRLVTGSSEGEQQQALARLRQKRSLPVNSLPLAWLNRLAVQSGVRWGAAAFPAVFMGVSAAVA